MPNPPALERLHRLHRLHNAYAELDKTSKTTLNDDERRSLRYFHADLAEHGRSGNRASSHDRATVWIRNVYHVEAFSEEFGRFPRENNRLPPEEIGGEERRLVTWLRAQRKLSLHSGHCSYQRDRLDVLPGFTESPLEERWTDNFEAYREFLQAHGIVPILSSDDAAERHLASWAAKQRHRKRAGKLPTDRVQILETLQLWEWEPRASS